MCLASALTGVVVVIYSFAGYIPKYRCQIPYCEAKNATYFNEKGELPQYVIEGIQICVTKNNEAHCLISISNPFLQLSKLFLPFLYRYSSAK